MSRRSVPGLRTQLVVAIALVTTAAVGASFLALYNGTGSRLRAQIDSQLRTQLAEWRQFVAQADLSRPESLQTLGRQFIAAQRYHAEALVIVIQVTGAADVTNDPHVLAGEEAREAALPERLGLLDSRPGFATVSVATVGQMRVLAQPIVADGRRVGTIRVGNPLTPVAEAQSSLGRTFVLVGSLALVAAVAAGIALATLIAAPLARMARVATAVEAGDLAQRVGPVKEGGEVRVLSEAFDHMLERLERAFRRQRDFVADASHELRTPLAVLRAQVELLDRETDAEQRHQGTATLLRRLDELDRLVSDILMLASVEGGQLVEPRPIDLSGFFEDLRRDLPLFGEREFECIGVSGTLTADPDRLTQVLRNLVRNAVNHTGPGDRVAVHAQARDGWLLIDVTDSGPGIPADRLDQIFERFHRLDPSRSRDRGGSGLGLAIARAITEAHGGHITAESAPGRGATFHLELPGYRALTVAEPAGGAPPPGS